jgi:hypothetical protein
MSTTTEELRQTRESSQRDDRFAHYAEADEVMRAYVEGVVIVALCGHVWVPVGGDPERHPVCPRCKTIYDALFLGAPS